MRVESPAGKFILSFERLEPAEGEILIIGKMGVWDAKTYMTPPEFLRLLLMTLTPSMLGFLIKTLFRGGFRTRTEGAK